MSQKRYLVMEGRPVLCKACILNHQTTLPMLRATFKVLLGELNAVIDKVIRSVPRPPLMLITCCYKKENKEKYSAVRKFLFDLWEVISLDCSFL